MIVRRSLAYFADLLTLIVVYSIVFFVSGILLFRNALIENQFVMILFYILFVLAYIAYFCVLPLFWKGQTLFKRALGIKIELSNNRIKDLIALIVKYLIVRFVLTIASFGLVFIVDAIYIKRHDGKSLIDTMLKLDLLLI